MPHHKKGYCVFLLHSVDCDGGGERGEGAARNVDLAKSCPYVAMVPQLSSPDCATN